MLILCRNYHKTALLTYVKWVQFLVFDYLVFKGRYFVIAIQNIQNCGIYKITLELEIYYVMLNV